ncbi:MAG: hypothetical protein VKP70_04330 [Cyanobacteriota bacterium]|nr:hypothetical protein [Cyanobacteriota bacterium]
MQVAQFNEDLRKRLRLLRSRMFPKQVLLEIGEDRLLGQTLGNGRPGPLCLNLPMPSYTCNNEGLPIQVDALADLIGELLLREGLIDAHVMASLPPQAVDWRVIDWGDGEMPEDGALALREREPDLGLPYPLAEATIDVRPLPTAPGRMLVVLTPRELVETWIEVFDQAGLSLDRLAAPQSCRLEALRGELARVSPDTLVLLITSQESELTERRLLAIKDGVPLFERVLPKSMELLIRDISPCVAFLQREIPDISGLELLLEGPLAEQEALEASLGQHARHLHHEPYGSLVMQGLAIPELTR